VGLAVEGYPVQTFDGGGRAASGAGEPVWRSRSPRIGPIACVTWGWPRELAVALESDAPAALDPPLWKPLVGRLLGRGGARDPEGCPRYVARVIRGLKVGPSPEWLRRRLESIGQRSINTVVDATNFVLWEMGQPLHAFDLGTLPGGEGARAQGARGRAPGHASDGKERELDPGGAGHRRPRARDRDRRA